MPFIREDVNGSADEPFAKREYTEHELARFGRIASQEADGNYGDATVKALESISGGLYAVAEAIDRFSDRRQDDTQTMRDGVCYTNQILEEGIKIIANALAKRK